MPDLITRMRHDWNGRASEDARFYIACSRRGEADADFSESAAEVLRRLRRDLSWLPLSRALPDRRFLEIGCGIGRLMRPMAIECGEIHGVDVSDEMIRLGRDWLSGLPRAHLHVGGGCDLSVIDTGSCDFVYSYAVMQHLPDASLFWSYWREILRVLRPGGVLALHFNSALDGRISFDSWAGITVPAEEVLKASIAAGLQVRSLEGIGTQYTWITVQKAMPVCRPRAPSRLLAVDRITGPEGARNLVIGGPAGHAEIFVRGLDPGCADIAGLSGCVAGRIAPVTYVAPDTRDGARQVNITVPTDAPGGRSMVQLLWHGCPLTEARAVMLTRYAAPPPRIARVTDGVELALERHICCGWAKAWVLHVTDPTSLRASIGGVPVGEIQLYCEDSLAARYQINLRMPSGLADGHHLLAMAMGEVSMDPVTLLIEQAITHPTA